MTDLAVAPLLAVGGSAVSVGSWAAALRLGAVLVVAVAVMVPLVGMLADAVDAAQIKYLEDLYLMEAHDYIEGEVDSR
jgi:hypothetical protein